MSTQPLTQDRLDADYANTRAIIDHLRSELRAIGFKKRANLMVRGGYSLSTVGYGAGAIATHGAGGMISRVRLDSIADAEALVRQIQNG